jgi:transposase
MAYSIDFRKRVIEFMDEGHTGKELYAAFKIYQSTVNNWRTLLEKTGSLEPQYLKTREGKINLEKLKQELERKPDLTLPELAKIFNCTKQSIDAACKKLKITRKKDFHIRGKRLGRSPAFSYDVHFICCFS